MGNVKSGAVLLAAVAVILCGVYLISSAYDRCSAAGGVLVKSVVWYTCINARP